MYFIKYKLKTERSKCISLWPVCVFGRRRGDEGKRNEGGEGRIQME
jgi:hypothetical protein